MAYRNQATIIFFHSRLQFCAYALCFPKGIYPKLTVAGMLILLLSEGRGTDTSVGGESGIRRVSNFPVSRFCNGAIRICIFPVAGLNFLDNSIHFKPFKIKVFSGIA